MSILIVEDNRVNATLLALILKAEGYLTVVAMDGKEGLRLVAETPDIQLIITDFMMPEMDGVEFIAKVRAMAAFRSVPILVASAHGDLETVKRVRSIQCDGFLVKPIDKLQLIKRVEQLVRTQSVVLRDKLTTMQKLDIGPKEYQDLLTAFAEQLTATLQVIVLEQGDSNEAISENLNRLLKDFAESALMLGAEKFISLYTKSMGGERLFRSQCRALLKVLQELDLEVITYAQSQ